MAILTGGGREHSPHGEPFQMGQSGSVPRVRPIDLPDLAWTAGAPVPVLVQSEQRALVAFEHIDGDARIIEFLRCIAVRFGFPNDEVQHGHPLWQYGLSDYSFHEVDDSPWLDELRRIEMVHPRAPAIPFAEARHLVLLFHDSMLEAIATDVHVVGSAATVEEAVATMAQMILPIG